jgi:anti-anti-sigma factor
MLNDKVSLLKEIGESPFQEVVIDMSECNYMCSLGLGALVLLQTKLNDKGKTMVLKNLSDFFKRELLETSLYKTFKVI